MEIYYYGNPIVDYEVDKDGNGFDVYDKDSFFINCDNEAYYEMEPATSADMIKLDRFVFALSNGESVLDTNLTDDGLTVVVNTKSQTWTISFKDYKDAEVFDAFVYDWYRRKV